jgi:protein gp37
MANRLHAMGQPRYRSGFKVTLQPDVADQPLRWKRPRFIFVNSMSDLFHEQVPSDYIARCFEVMNQASRHTFQLLTKRPERLVDLASELPWPRNLWLGVSVEKAQYVPRIKFLTRVPCFIRFLSLEPLLGPIPQLPLEGIHWVIVGGESGPKARPMQESWVTEIRDLCIEKNVPFFFKQWGGVNKSKTGRKLEGNIWHQMPRQREFIDATASDRPLARTVRAA